MMLLEPDDERDLLARLRQRPAGDPMPIEPNTVDDRAAQGLRQRHLARCAAWAPRHPGGERVGWWEATA
jgi:hypothetical protein